ncbi:MAG: glutathione S-transferase family protein [Aquabacterium sp.]
MTTTLHFYPGNASLIPHILLRELGEPFELALVDRNVNAQKSPEYLRLNPNGLIPVLVQGEQVLYETAAIALHLADTHPQAGLMPPLGTPERAQAYKWLMWLTNTVQATMIPYFYPDRFVDAGDADAAAQVKRQAQIKLGGCFDQLDALLAGHGGPWLLGERYSLLDAYTLTMCRWSRGFSGPESAPARERPHLRPYLDRMLARPAVRAAFAAEGIQAPWF